MKRLSRLLTALLSIMIIVSMLAACGTVNQPQQTTAATQSPAETTAPDPKQASGTIEFWMNPAGFQSDDAQKAWAQKAVDEFNEIYPNMKVNITILPWADSATNKQLRLSTGTNVPNAMHTFP